MTDEPDIVERLRRYADDIRANGERSELDDAADEIERHWREKVKLASLVAKERDENKHLRALLRRHHLRGAFWDSDLAVETRAALEPKP